MTSGISPSSNSPVSSIPNGDQISQVRRKGDRKMHVSLKEWWIELSLYSQIDDIIVSNTDTEVIGTRYCPASWLLMTDTFFRATSRKRIPATLVK